MALSCVKWSRECVGCGACRAESGGLFCRECERPIAAGQEYVEYMNDVFCEDCWEDVTARHKRVG